jgi:zinc/manganese transport system substrate-binding protein
LRARAGIIARMARLAALTCLLATLALPGCGSDRATRGDGTVDVLVTTPLVADIVARAGGRRVDVQLARGGAAGADLVVVSGGGVDAPAAVAGADRTLTLLPLVDPLDDDPYWWHDPARVERAAKEIRNELAEIDVHGAGYYEVATADFLGRLRKLDGGIRRCLGAVPRPWAPVAVRRGAFAYFADRYGVEFRARRRGLRLRATRIEGSYLDTMALNAAAIVDAVSRGRVSCRPQ